MTAGGSELSEVERDLLAVATAVGVTRGRSTRPGWRKSSRSGTDPYGNCVEVAVAATCVRRFCDEAATTVRDDVELCGFCAAERGTIAVDAAFGAVR